MDYNSIAQIIEVLPDYLTLPLLYLIRYYFYKNFLGFKNKIWVYIVASLFLVIFDYFTGNFLTVALSSILDNILLFLTVYLLCERNLIIRTYAFQSNNWI